MFSLFGFLGQTAHNRFTAPSLEPAEPKQSFWKRMSEKPFSPVKHLSNDEYAEMLREKMFKVDVEISILEDKIAALKKEQQSPASEQPEPETDHEK